MDLGESFPIGLVLLWGVAAIFILGAALCVNEVKSMYNHLKKKKGFLVSQKNLKGFVPKKTFLKMVVHTLNSFTQ